MIRCGLDRVSSKEVPVNMIQDFERTVGCVVILRNQARSSSGKSQKMRQRVPMVLNPAKYSDWSRLAYLGIAE